jgi:glycogen operon protein
VNFALFSENAERVELCLFDARGRRELHRIRLPEYTSQIWHVYLPDVRPGQLYGYRVHGPYDPQRGHRFNSNKLLLDPYAKALTGTFRWSDAHFGYRLGHRAQDLSFDRRNNAAGMPKCRVVDTAYTWAQDRPPRRPWHETILYELHVRGFTMLHPDVPQALRGTFAGLSTPAAIRYLRGLGITAVELLPVQAFVDDRLLLGRRLRNYWGYNTIAFFAPHPPYLAGATLTEFKALVQHLHDAEIEVILDVVYNHTAEGNQLGPTLCFRGIDNASYYRLVPGDGRHYMDFTGCGNALNLRHPCVLQLVMDSLRYWVEEMHVDGFRFDLATTLAREKQDFDQHSGFLDAVHQDPVLSQVKLIAEPWDVGHGGYRVGQFPPGWAEWNDRYRDTVRRFWKGDPGQVGELASRMTGSSDAFDRKGRRPWASINFVTAHDGFTLHDVVSYDRKHNEANQENNRDGTDANHSWNCGVEGPTEDPLVRQLRERQKRNLLATLLLSQGVPMILAGDETGRSQRGNNNAYCQDNEISWIEWEIDADGGRLNEFIRQLIRLRRDHTVFRRHRFFHGLRTPESEIKDITWLLPEGRERRPEDWHDPEDRCLGCVLSGEAHEYHVTAFGEPEPDDTFLMILNAHSGPVAFTLPPARFGARWEGLIDTNVEGPLQPRIYRAGEAFPAAGRSLRGPRPPARDPHASGCRRLVPDRGPRHRGRNPLPVLHREPPPRPRPRVALPARGCPGAERGDRSGGVRMARRELARPAVARCSDLRATRRRVHTPR